MTGYVKKTDEVYPENPWGRELALTMQRGNKIVAMGKSSKILDAVSGELLDQDIAMVSKKIVDRTEFIKIFEGGISHLFSLSKAAQELFQIVLLVYLDEKFKGDRVYISPKALKDAGYTRTRVTMSNALNQLLEKGFLARVTEEKNLFWVNPNMFFKGDRMRMIQEYAIEGTASGDQMKVEQDKMISGSKQLRLDV